MLGKATKYELGDFMGSRVIKIFRWGGGGAVVIG